MSKSDWQGVVEIPRCHQKAFDQCFYKENDEEFCEICMLDAITHLKRRLRLLHRSMRRERDKYK